MMRARLSVFDLAAQSNTAMGGGDVSIFVRPLVAVFAMVKLAVTT